MKTKNLHLERLIKLARCIGEDYLIDTLFNDKKEYQSNSKGSNIEHFSWLLWELPEIFREWRFGDNKVPCYRGDQSMNPITAAGAFFNLTVDELFHLFVPGFQMEEYMGKDLHPNSTPDDVAHNIYQFVHYKEFEMAEAQLPVRIKSKSKEVKIKKLKFHEPLNNYYHEKRA